MKQLPDPDNPLPFDQIIHGDCIEVLDGLPPESVDLVFADPPYNLQLHQDLWRPNQTLVDPVDEEWDRFSNFAAYDQFTAAWLSACRRILKPTGTIWVIGSYHNIFRLGSRLQDLDFWILNDIVWIKDNPMPNFRGVRFTNAHEMLVWAQKERGAPYTFNHQAARSLNEDLQMRSDWYLPICTGPERLRQDGAKAHPTQKPEALLYRVLLTSSNPGDIVLDPFFGTGTTGVVAKRLHRRWIGIESNLNYIELARQRIAVAPSASPDPHLYLTPNRRKQPRLPFGMLLEYQLIEPGQELFLLGQPDRTARVLADGSIEWNGQRGSIHQVARLARGHPETPCNGWEQWYYLDPQSITHRPLNHLREQLRQLLAQNTTPE